MRTSYFVITALMSAMIVVTDVAAGNVVVQDLTPKPVTNSRPSHCRADEISYLDASMGNIEGSPKNIGEVKVIKNGKILSLCVDVENGVASQLVYRYGAIGNVELEKVATANNKFWAYSRYFDPHVSDNLIFFNIGKYTYYISIPTGQGNRLLELMVMKSGRNVFSLFSNDHEERYASYLDTFFTVKEPPNLSF